MANFRYARGRIPESVDFIFQAYQSKETVWPIVTSTIDGRL